jgi:hypothetical protein
MYKAYFLFPFLSLLCKMTKSMPRKTAGKINTISVIVRINYGMRMLVTALEILLPSHGFATRRTLV